MKADFKPQLGMTEQALKGTEIKITPGVRGSAKRKFSVFDKDNKEIIVNKGDEIIIQPLEGGKFNITPFVREASPGNPDLPESQRNIVPGETYISANVDPRSHFNFEEHYALSSQPLFQPGSPKLGDVQQSQLPDCFLLAAIQAILNEKNGDVFIKSMMRQHEDGTTTVRLFDPKTKEPVYIRVQTATLIDKDGALNRHPALWVHILENAYVGLAKKHGNSINQIRSVDSSAGSVFSGGGFGSIAMEILTGLTSDKRHYPKHASQQNKIWDFTERNLADIAEAQKRDNPARYLNSTMFDKIDRASSITAYKNNPEAGQKDITAFMFFYQKNSEACELIVKDATRSDGNKLFALMDLAITTNDIAAANFIKNVQNHMSVQIADEKGNVTGAIRGDAKSFSGVYNVKKMEIYNDIVKGLTNNQLITAGTESATDENPIMSGLHGGHVYTVLGVRQDEAGNRFIKLRNPWGKGGMQYTGQDNTSEDSNKAIFEVELNDFCNNFNNVEISKPAKNLFAKDAERAEIIQQANDLVNNHSIDTESTLMELVDFKHDNKMYENRLIKLEKQCIEAIQPHSLIMIQSILSSDYPDEAREEIDNLIANKEITLTGLAGNREQQLEQVTRLLQLSFLEKSPHTNAKAIAETKSLIIKNAGYDFCDKINADRIIVDTIAVGFAKDFTKGVQACQKLATDLEAQQKAILVSGNLNDATKNAELLQTYQQLKSQFNTLLVEKSYLSNLDISFNDEELLNIKRARVNGEEFISEHEDAMPLSDDITQLKTQIIEDLDLHVAGKRLSPENAEHCKECIQLNSEPGNLKIKEELAKQFCKSENPQLQRTGEKMSFLARMEQKLSRMMDALWSLVSGNPKNSYNVIEAKPTVSTSSWKDRLNGSKNENHQDTLVENKVEIAQESKIQCQS